MRIGLTVLLLLMLTLVTGCGPSPQGQQPQMPSEAQQSPQGVLQTPSQGVDPNQNYPSNQVGPGMMNGTQGPFNRVQGKTDFKSNGERIYFTGQDNVGNYIRANSIGMPMSSIRAGCSTCHGPQGKGGTIRFMMGTIDFPDIRYKTLSQKDPDMKHPAYTDETLKRAITQGIDPGGQPLNPPMPRWQMDSEDLNDIISYLKSLP